jgi:MarR family transcriptional regulator, organic hydroperoxide resistance regulator
MRPVARPAPKRVASPLRRPRTHSNDVDEILKILVFLYTENRRFTKQLAARASLTGPQLTVVKMLETMGDLSLSELSDAIRAQNSTVTGIIDRMEREGIVERARSTEDRRVVRIHLTDKGKKLAAEIPIEPITIFRAALESLSPTEARELLKMVNKISSRVRTAILRGMGDLPVRAVEGEPE